MTNHPTLFRSTVRCSTCGAGFEMRSTRQQVAVDVCSQCHPAYTGRERSIAGSDRVEKFNRRWAQARQAA